MICILIYMQSNVTASILFQIQQLNKNLTISFSYNN